MEPATRTEPVASLGVAGQLPCRRRGDGGSQKQSSGLLHVRRWIAPGQCECVEERALEASDVALEIGRKEGDGFCRRSLGV